jgi:hypothetical protein
LLHKLLRLSDAFDYVKRVASAGIGRDIGTTWWEVEQTGIVKETPSNEDMLEIGCLKPDLRIYIKNKKERINH